LKAKGGDGDSTLPTVLFVSLKAKSMFV